MHEVVEVHEVALGVGATTAIAEATTARNVRSVPNLPATDRPTKPAIFVSCE